MASYLFFEELEVLITGFQENDPELVGDEDRAWSGKLRSSVSGEIRKWSGTAREMTHADFTVLRNKIKNGIHVPCSGPALGGLTFNCVVRLRGAVYTPVGESHLVTVQFEMETVDPVI
jgi:hypothetical protein